MRNSWIILVATLVAAVLTAQTYTSLASILLWILLFELITIVHCRCFGRGWASQDRLEVIFAVLLGWMLGSIYYQNHQNKSLKEKNSL